MDIREAVQWLTEAPLNPKRRIRRAAWAEHCYLYYSYGKLFIAMRGSLPSPHWDFAGRYLFTSLDLESRDWELAADEDAFKVAPKKV